MRKIPPDQVRFCEGCRQPRHTTHFLPDSPYCAVCRELGPKYPQQVGGGEGKEREGVMADMVKCDECGKEVNARGLALHKTRVHRGLGGRPTPSRAGKARATRQQAKRKLGRPPRTAKPAAPKPNGCEECLFRGLHTAIAQERVAELVRLGVKLPEAAGFVRRMAETSRG